MEENFAIFIVNRVAPSYMPGVEVTSKEGSVKTGLDFPEPDRMGARWRPVPAGK